ncbi:hypothetical protein DSM3645_15195 [Blastopirellula marina DSM 3645]|uniref:Polysaccharide pyruvyl transferase domain-containing protein n=2 Tax=Blastopirellula marina TaxID=124 RepID=A4A258_9BACT|nr:hypothetical protein DSM3645_15195 [Blastopirellula marina DSM 3645]
MIHPVVHESQDYLLHAPHWHARRFGYVADSFNLEIINGDLLTAKIERLVYAKFVYTSSLHVAITCIAYGVPFGLFLNRQEKANLTAKWRDVWSTLVHREGRHPGQPKFFHSLHQCRDWWVDEGCYLLPPSMDQMVAAFPHDIAY